MPPPRTPKGIALLAAIYFLMAGAFAVIAGLFAVAPASLHAFGFRPDLDAWVRLSGVSFLAAVAAIAGAIGSGLWRLKQRARLVVMVSAVSTLLVGVIDFSGSVFGDATPFGYLRVAALVLPLAVLWYLWTPGVRTAFEVQQ